jgi:hypothetical protein
MFRWFVPIMYPVLSLLKDVPQGVNKRVRGRTHTATDERGWAKRILKRRRAKGYKMQRRAYILGGCRA